MKQNDLAFECRLIDPRAKIHACQISQYEHRRRQPSLEQAVNIAEALGVTVNDLIYGGEQGSLPYGECAVLATA